jgi:hypothetical protein
VYRNSHEIKVVEDWRWVWWDKVEDREYFGSATGTVINHVERRHIQNIYGRIAHIPDDGKLQLVFDSEDCGEYQVRLRCLTCGKEFCADI